MTTRREGYTRRAFSMALVPPPPFSPTLIAARSSVCALIMSSFPRAPVKPKSCSWIWWRGRGISQYSASSTLNALRRAYLYREAFGSRRRGRESPMRSGPILMMTFSLFFFFVFFFREVSPPDSRPQSRVWRACAAWSSPSPSPAPSSPWADSPPRRSRPSRSPPAGRRPCRGRSPRAGARSRPGPGRCRATCRRTGPPAGALGGRTWSRRYARRSSGGLGLLGSGKGKKVFGVNS